jgi:hypothetical protein
MSRFGEPERGAGMGSARERILDAMDSDRPR